MTRRFVAIVDDASKEQQDTVTNWLRSTPLGFWHYLTDVWLIADWQDKHTTVTIRDQFRALLPGKTTLVLTVEDPNAWAGFGPSDGFKWLHSTWAGKPAP